MNKEYCFGALIFASDNIIKDEEFVLVDEIETLSFISANDVILDYYLLYKH